ncbi:MAG: hypothetical protein HFH41_12520 [Lachnospiraceae bacterium]|nr:hypothetical protein [Lachnospiraceae bacterium]
MKIGNPAENVTTVKTEYGTNRLEKQTEEKQQNKLQGKSIDASELNLFQDGIADKKKKAMKDAMDFVKQQFESDSEVDKIMEECRDQITEGKEQAVAAVKEIKSIQEQKEQLKEEYPDGGEEYEAYMKDLNEMEGHWRKEMENGQAMVSDSTRAIKSIKQEALKHHGMIDAFQAAEDTLKAASEEMMGMLLNEGKETVEEKLEETVEKAEEAKEEKTEQEEEMKEAQLEREKRAKEIEEELEKMRRARENSGGSRIKNLVVTEELQRRQMEVIENTNQILEEQALLPEEIKGIVVDFNL